MVFNVDFLSPLEHILPSWLASSRLQWLCWAYALWQLVRTNKCVLWILSVIPHLLRVILRSKRAVVLVAPISSVTYVSDNAATYSEGEEAFWQGIHGATTFEVVPQEQRQTWPSSWRAIKYQGWYYFTSEQALRRMAYLMDVIRPRGCQEHNLIFAEYRELSLVAENISKDDAYGKVLSGDYFVKVLDLSGDYFVKRRDTVSVLEAVKLLEGWLLVVTWINHVEVNKIWWAGLSIIPPLLQLWGLNRLSNALTVFIILIDFNRNLLRSLYESLFHRFRIWLKSRLPPFKPPNITCVVLYCLAMCSMRWAPTVTRGVGGEKPWGNVLGTSIRLYNFSKVKHLEDVTIHNDGGGHYAYAQYRENMTIHNDGGRDHAYAKWHDADAKAVVCIQGRTGYVVPICTLKPFTYANATVNTGVFVE